MRTNYAGFVVTVGMGFVVLLLGLLGLSAAGLTNFAPGLAEVETADTEATFAVGEPVANRLSVPSVPLTAEQQAGEALFKNNCAQCHAVNEKVVGPALAGIDKRRPISWITAWVHNPAKVIASGDEYAVKLFNDNGKQQMPAFPQLSEQDVQAIIAWVSSQQGVAPVVEAGAVVAVR